MSALDFSAPADAKVGDVSISVGNMWSDNKLTWNSKPGAKMGDLSINVGNMWSNNTSVLNLGGKAPSAKNQAYSW